MRNERKNGKIMYVFGFSMVVFYITMAAIIMCTSLFEQRFSPIVRYLFGGFFFLYGVFRAWRVIKYRR